MAMQLQLDERMAIRIAEYFDKNGLPHYADHMWLEISAATAYGNDLREELGDVMFDTRQAAFAHGTADRARFILEVMAISFPSEKLVAAYFENLEQMFADRPKRARPGEVVLGIGSGRCGSTTLAAAFAALPDSCATHENPPKIYWEPLEAQARFHLNRLRFLADYHAVVFDAAHWWIRILDRVFAEFPGAKVIGLARDTESCVESFLRFQGRGLKSSNHWAPPNNGIWMTQIWDPAYPTYVLPPGPRPNANEADAIKAAMIARYVTEYNQTLAALAAAQPQRVAVIRTEAMNQPDTVDRLRALLGMPLEMPSQALNVGNNKEGRARELLAVTDPHSRRRVPDIRL